VITTVRQLRLIIREELKRHAVGGSDPNEAYDSDLVDDLALKKTSIYVNDDAKREITSWIKDMGLSTDPTSTKRRAT